jgi:hypothetical protein
VPSVIETFEIRIAAHRRGRSRDGCRDAAGIRLDTPAWLAWLEAETTTRFAYPVFDPAHGYVAGFMTVRKEQRQRGGVYWVAYRRCQGRLRKVYLGRAATLTQARLDTIAQAFRLRTPSQARPDQPMPGGRSPRAREQLGWLIPSICLCSTRRGALEWVS